MELRSGNNKKIYIVAGVLIFLLLAAGIAFALLFLGKDEEERIYKETTVSYGPLTVGITEEGTVAVGTIEQDFELDISEYSDSSAQAGFMRGPMDARGSAAKSRRSLEVEEIYVSVGQEIEKGAPLFKLTDESVEEIRRELVSDEKEAKLNYDNLSVQRYRSEQEASWTYEQNRVYGSAAAQEYDEALYELQKAVEDAQDTLTDAQEDLADYQDDLEEVKADYTQALHYLEEATAAVALQSDTYWYLQNEESREQAQSKVDEEEDRIEELEDQIFDKEQEIVSLQAALNEAQKAYQIGEADASTQYDKRLYSLKQAAEIYGIATDQIEYQTKTAREDYQDASGKLEDFDEYIRDGLVFSAYEGVVTGVEIAAGDKLQSDDALITLNNYEDITLKVDVDDDDIGSVAAGDTVRLSFTAFPDGEFTGVVSDIGDASIDSSSDITYAVEIDVSGDVSGLYEGMTGDVTFITKETKDVTHVSNRAIFREGTRSYVKLRDTDGTITEKDVITGFSDGSDVEILDGLTAGDVVLIESRVKSE